MKGQGQRSRSRSSKRSNSQNGYNFRSNCYRDFKLGSYFSLWKAASNMTFNLTKGQGQDWEKGQIHLIGYNFRSNCHRDFKLGSCFSLWKPAPNMTLILTFDLDLEKLAQAHHNFSHRVMKLSGINCYFNIWKCSYFERSRSGSNKRSNPINWL